MTIRRRSSSPHPACVASGPSPTGKSWGDVASLGIKQRERVELLVWQLLFVGCLTRVLYRHLDLQFFNLFVCRNPTSPGLVASGCGMVWVRFVLVHFDDITFLDK